MKRLMKPLSLTTCAMLLSATLAMPAPARAEDKKGNFLWGLIGGVTAVLTLYNAYKTYQQHQEDDKAKQEAEEEKARRTAQDRARMTADSQAVAPYFAPPVAAPVTRY